MFGKVHSKKAVSELVSFILILLLVVIASTIAYIFASNLLDEREAQYNEQRMESLLKRFNAQTQNILAVDQRATTLQLDFTRGQVTFQGNQIIYTSLARFDGLPYCLGVLCFESGGGGFTIISTNVSETQQFSSTQVLGPGSYLILLQNQNESEIRIEVR